MPCVPEQYTMAVTEWTFFDVFNVVAVHGTNSVAQQHQPPMCHMSGLLGQTSSTDEAEKEFFFLKGFIPEV